MFNQRLPIVTKNLLIINIILFAATYMLKKQGIDLTEKLGLHYYKAPMFKPYQFITYLFMHGNLMHIFFNMFAVFMFGSVLENVWGPKKFLTYYIFTGLGAALTQFVVYYFQLKSDVNMLQIQAAYEHTTNYIEQTQLIELRNAYLNSPGFTVVGASGSLFGLLIAFGYLFPNTELMMMFLPIPIKAKYFVALYGAIELFSGIANTESDNVAHFAHLGGMLFGFILLMIWRQRSR
jgi:membrane associated rhomboid family serine protease